MLTLPDPLPSQLEVECAKQARRWVLRGRVLVQVCQLERVHHYAGRQRQQQRNVRRRPAPFGGAALVQRVHIVCPQVQRAMEARAVQRGGDVHAPAFAHTQPLQRRCPVCGAGWFSSFEPSRAHVGGRSALL